MRSQNSQNDTLTSKKLSTHHRSASDPVGNTHKSSRFFGFDAEHPLKTSWFFGSGTEHPAKILAVLRVRDRTSGENPRGSSGPGQNIRLRVRDRTPGENPRRSLGPGHNIRRKSSPFFGPGENPRGSSGRGQNILRRESPLL